MNALMIEPLALGTVILKKVYRLLFPRSLEAISSFSSIPDSADAMREKATGKLRYTWAIITEGKEYKNFMLFSLRPRDKRRLLRIPLFP